MISNSSREYLREALLGVTNLRTEALILIGAIPYEDLPEIIQILRRKIGLDEPDLH